MSATDSVPMRLAQSDSVPMRGRCSSPMPARAASPLPGRCASPMGHCVQPLVDSRCASPMGSRCASPMGMRAPSLSATTVAPFPPGPGLHSGVMGLGRGPPGTMPSFHSGFRDLSASFERLPAPDDLRPRLPSGPNPSWEWGQPGAGPPPPSLASVHNAPSPTAAWSSGAYPSSPTGSHLGTVEPVGMPRSQVTTVLPDGSTITVPPVMGESSAALAPHEPGFLPTNSNLQDTSPNAAAPSVGYDFIPEPMGRLPPKTTIGGQRRAYPESFDYTSSHGMMLN